MKYRIQQHSKALLADLQTPVGIYLKVRDLFPESALLESSDYHGKEDARSIIGIAPMARFEVRNGQASASFPDGSCEKTPLSEGHTVLGLLKAFLDRFEVTGDPAPINGLLGYTSANAAYLFEDTGVKLADTPSDTPPTMLYILYRILIVINHFNNELTLIENREDGVPSRLEEIRTLLASRNTVSYGFTPRGEETSPIDDATYEAMVRRGVAHCRRGDVFQIVLSRRFERPFSGDDFQVYRALRSINPSPYLFYFDFGSFRIFGSSPEAQCQVQGDHASIDPIAGTFGATLYNLERVRHGEADAIHITADTPLFRGLENPFTAGRYHSWAVSREGFPDCLEITATAQDGAIMALRHKEHDIHGVQFHPESILTPEGRQLIANFLQTTNHA